ncbi:MAG: alpha/beta fold hydrolase [Chloroflexota bacterium]|nr:MAG: alpha/beta fold hydrolase [Chloroflexota bacterium]
MKSTYILLLIVLILVTGCSQTAAEVQPTEQPLKTDIPLSPTNTPEPILTSTPSPPTDTPEPTATATRESSPTPDIPKEAVTISYDEQVIRGILVGEGDIAVVLAPMYGESRGSWMHFAEHIASLGYAALAFDFPGPFGTSSGTFKFDGVQFDVLAVIDFLRQRGYERIVCMGASIGGTACFEAALLDPTLAGFVNISSPIEKTSEELSILLMPKLIVISDDDEFDVSPLNDVFELLPAPKQIEFINKRGHGTELLTMGNELQDILVAFLDSLQDL